MYLTKSMRDILEKLITELLSESAKLYQRIIEVPKEEIVSQRKNTISYIRNKIATEIGQELLKDGILVIEQRKDTIRNVAIFYARLRVLKPEIFGKKTRRIAGRGEKPDTLRPKPAPRPQKKYIERR